MIDSMEMTRGTIKSLTGSVQFQLSLQVVDLLEELNMSNKDAALLLNVSKEVMSQIEYGDYSVPTAIYFTAIRQLTEVKNNHPQKTFK